MTDSALDSTHPYTLSSIRQMLGLSRHAVVKLVALGFGNPERAPGGAYRFSFRDVVVLRSAHALRLAGIPTRSILRSLRRLRAQLPAEMPLSGLRILAVGDTITVRAQDAQWEPDTGQMVIDFNVESNGSTVSLLSMPGALAGTRAQQIAPLQDVDAMFANAEALEDTDLEAAEAAYRSVLAIDPDHAHSYLNLGFMLCEGKRFAEAADLYDTAARHCDDDPLVHYNRAVALEALGRLDEAPGSYERCLVLQSDLADAHQNAALLYAQLGQKQMAIRHFSAYRRLQASS